MATVKNTIRLQDKMTPVLRSIIKAMNSTASVMATTDRASGTAFRRMQTDIRRAEEALSSFNNEAAELPAAAGRGAAAFGGLRNPLVNAVALIYSMKMMLEGIGNITNLSDTYTYTNARLQMMNDGLQTTAQLQDMIFASANASRSAYTDTAASVAKLGNLAGEAFKNTQEIVAFSELMNKSFKIGGASIQEQTAGMYQLTQAMAAGKLQGDEFRSIMENAPKLAEAIAIYTGKTKGELKQMSSDGLITSDIIKNAMFAAANDINSQFKSIPMTWGDAMTMMKNDAYRTFIPVFEKLTAMVNTQGFQQFTANFATAMQGAADWALDFLEKMQNTFSWIQSNWPVIRSTIEGALAGIAVAYAGAKTAALLYAFAQGLVNLELLILNARLAGVALLVAAAVFLWSQWGVVGQMLAIILGALAAAILVCTVAQYAFNTALWASPVVWVIAAIVALIAIFAVLMLWLIDLWKTNMDFKYGVIKIWNDLLKFFDHVPIFFAAVGHGIVSVFEGVTVGVLSVVQGMANGVIGIINAMIGALNKIPGVAIEAIGEVSFATQAAAASKANSQARQNGISNMEAAAQNKANERTIKAAQARAKDEASLAEKAAKANAEKNKQNTGAAGSLGDSVNSAATPDWKSLANPTVKGGKIDEVGGDISIKDEDIKLLKDVAATEFVNKYTTLRPEMHVVFGDVRETADVEQILTVIEDMVVEAYASSLVNA